MAAKFDDLEVYYKIYSNRFQDLAKYLIYNYVLIKLFPHFPYHNFPAGEEDIERIEDLLREHNYIEKENEGIKLTELSEETYLWIIDFLKNYERYLGELDISDPESFTKMSDYCTAMYLSNIIVVKANELTKKNHSINLDRLTSEGSVVYNSEMDYQLMSKAHQLIGYWTAKMEEKKRNLKSVSVKTQKKLENKEVLKKILSEHNFQSTRDVIIKAMSRIDRGERTVKNLIKEITKETQT
jgi:hypothetical protein